MDPARFWDITPRLLALEFKGISIKQRQARELVWLGAAMSRTDRTLPTYGEFMGIPVDRVERAAMVNAAWDRVDKALARRH